MLLAQNPEETQELPNYKNMIGIQINPNRDFNALVYGIRYGYNISKPIIIGSEISGSMPAFKKPSTEYSNFKFGFYIRYSFMPEKRVRVFMETQPFYSYSYTRATEMYEGDDVEENKFGIYAAPGLSIFTKNRKFSMDIYYKFFIDPGNYYGEASYKISFHF
jgi:hypothetical protein